MVRFHDGPRQFFERLMINLEYQSRGQRLAIQALQGETFFEVDLSGRISIYKHPNKNFVDCHHRHDSAYLNAVVYYLYFLVLLELVLLLSLPSIAQILLKHRLRIIDCRDIDFPTVEFAQVIEIGFVCQLVLGER